MFELHIKHSSFLCALLFGLVILAQTAEKASLGTYFYFVCSIPTVSALPHYNMDLSRLFILIRYQMNPSQILDE